MKNFFKAFLFFTLGLVTVLAFQQKSIKPLTLNEVFAQSGLSQYITPEKFINQINQTPSRNFKTGVKIPYALPFHMPLFNIVGSMYSGYSIEYSIINGQIETSPVFQDLNGDGLADLIYSGPERSLSYSSFSEENLQYVLLNNGEGFDLVYFCLARLAPTNPASNQIYGDCAAPL